MKTPTVLLLLLVSLTCRSQIVIGLDSSYYKTRPIDCFSGFHPLYVVDNKIFPCDSVQSINPRNIEAINIYKGAEAQALYGAAGSRNGTVAITTKKYAALIRRNENPDETEKP